MFPSSLDDLSTTRATSGTDKLSSPDHLVHHAAEDTLIEAIQAKVGVDSSAVVASLDYLVKNPASINPGHMHNFLSALDGVPAQAVYVDAAGNVGIGTTSPSAMLAVGASSQFQVSSTGDILTSSTGELTIGGTGASSIAGNLGIGTTGPVSELHIKDSSAAVQLTLEAATGYNPGIAFREGGSNSWEVYSSGGTTNNPLMFYDYASGSNMVTFKNGNVGIGITGPLAKCHIDQSVSDAAIPVLALDQADVSEGFINFLGATAASAAGPISSWTAGNTIQGFVRVEINNAQFWSPYYDAPTS